MRQIFDVPYSEREGALINFYLPDEDNFPTVIFFHGGGIEAGSRKMDPQMAEALTNQGVAFASVEYRMYPTARFPEFIEDAAESAAWIKKNVATYGGNDKIFISGSSAGAYLTMMLYCDKKYLAAHGLTSSDFTGFISDSSQMTTHFNVLRERGLDTKLERIDEGAPLFFIDKDLEIAPLILIYYSKDMVCRPEQNKLFHRAITRFFPDAKIPLVELPGGHCAGRLRKENGEYDLINTIMNFVKPLI